jgi:hypothetical protein
MGDASPENSAPGTLAVMVVCVPPPHADNCPDKLANRNLLAVPSGNANSVVSLNTVPVGAGCVVTTNGGCAGPESHAGREDRTPIA